MSGHRSVFLRALSRGGPSGRTQVESDQHPLGVRQIADDLLNGLGQSAHQRRHSENLVAAGELRVLQQVDHLDVIAPGEILLADAFEIGVGTHTFGRLPRYIQPQQKCVAV